MLYIHAHILHQLTSGGVNIDNLDKTSEPSLFSQHGPDGGVSGGESVEEAEEPPQLALPLLH